MSAKSPNSILVQLMESGEFSDLKFVCNGQEFKVHKAIVCVQSPVLKAATQGGFEESDTNVITMHNFQPNTVRRLIQFIYTGDYDDHEDEQGSPGRDACRGDIDEIGEVGLLVNQLQFSDTEENNTNPASKAPAAPSPPESTVTASLFANINVNSIGDYYGIDKLVSLANTKIKHLLRSDTEDQSWVADLPTAIDTAVQSTGDDELLGILASATVANISSLLGSDQFKNLGVLTDFSIKVLHACAQEFQALAGQQEESNLQLCKAEEQIQQCELELSGLRGCLEVLRKTGECRLCNADFLCFIDPYERLLRCAKCRCKHYS